MFQTRVVAAPGALISWSQTPAISSRVKSVLLAGAAFMNQDRPDQPEASGKRTHVGSDRGVTQSQQIAYSTCDRQSTSNIAGHPTQPILIPFPAVILITTSWWDIAMGKVGPSFARTCSTTSPKRGRIATSVRPPQTSAQRRIAARQQWARKQSDSFRRPNGESGRTRHRYDLDLTAQGRQMDWAAQGRGHAARRYPTTDPIRYGPLGPQGI